MRESLLAAAEAKTIFSRDQGQTHDALCTLDFGIYISVYSLQPEKKGFVRDHMLCLESKAALRQTRDQCTLLLSCAIVGSAVGIDV